MAKLIIRNNESALYPIVSYAFINNAIDIWIKFSSYLKPEELLFMDGLKGNDLSSISQAELDEYHRIKKQIEISKLFSKYKNKECNKEEYNKVIDYMNNIPLKTLIKSKLTDKEKFDAEQFVSELLKRKELEEYIKLNEDNYDNLDIYKSYILFIAKEKLYKQNEKVKNEKIKNETIERTINLIKNLNRDYQ